MCFFFQVVYIIQFSFYDYYTIRIHDTIIHNTLQNMRDYF